MEAFQLDQLIVAILFAPAALGLYVVALAFTNLPRFIAHSLGMVAYPRIAAASHPRSGPRALWRYVALAMAFIAPLVIVLELTVEWLVPFFFGEAYAGAASVARVLLIAALFQSARRILADAARGQGHPELGTVAEIASWIVLVPAIIVLESRGLSGIAMAMTVTYGASLAVLIVAVVTRVGQPPKAGRGVTNTGAPTSATGEVPA